MTNPSSGHFQLSITKALGDQLAAALENLTPAPLTTKELDKLDGAPGVYQLYRHGHFVYVGKAEDSLPKRLGEHLKKISGRTLPDEEMTFTCLYVEEDLSAVAPEQLLIKRHRAAGEIPWNGSGFGRHDPGKNRDKTEPDPKDFDTLFPVDLAVPLANLKTGPQSLRAFAKKVKKELPYLFRIAKSTGLDDVPVDVSTGDMTADEAFRLIASRAPAKWQIIALTGYVIMYKTGEETYASARRYYRSTDVIDTGLLREALPIA